MKAITCTQCGALIKSISLREEFAVCDYCGAKILLEENREKIVEIPTARVAPDYVEIDSPIDAIAKNPFTVGKLFLIIGFGVFITIMFFVVGKTAIEQRSNSKEKTLAAPGTPYFPSPTFPTVDSTDYPRINYQVSVKWDGADDMEHFENPSIDGSKLTTSDEKELKKTVFKNRSVQVRVTINENGEVTEATAISGHPILKEAAENAARKTLFANRSKPTKRLLTYIFRLISE